MRRADAGEPIVGDGGTIVDANAFSETASADEDDSSHDKIEALAAIICDDDQTGKKSAALLVLMASIEHATHPKALANLAKHVAFTRCGELNFNGMVDDQITVLECELFANKPVHC